MNGKHNDLTNKGMATIFERKPVVTIIMSFIRFIVHSQELKERYFGYLILVFSIMLDATTAGVALP
ncbi:MAG: hypothetical protein U5K54_12230 [Cytophagales bacterium]|nr:hypothetical protein [Cytophagales bacterium]